MPATIEKANTRPIAPAKTPTADKPSATAKKSCAGHKGPDPIVSVREFDLNPLTSDGLHVQCRACTKPGDLERRVSRARHQLTKARLSPFCPIVMAQEGGGS